MVEIVVSRTDAGDDAVPSLGHAVRGVGMHVLEETGQGGAASWTSVGEPDAG
jgi:hypothetical protein